MDEQPSQEYNPTDTIGSDQVPDDTITVIIKCGGRTFFKGMKLAETQEDTALLVGNMMQSVLDTVDARGLKVGGGEFNPEGK